MLKQINWYKQAFYMAFPLSGYFIGRWLEGMEDERMTKFRDKSALYGKVLAEGAKPSWP